MPKGLRTKRVTPHTSLRSGVIWLDGKWHVGIRHQGTHLRIRGDETEEDDAKLHDKVVIALLEEPICNNLPDGSLNPDRKCTEAWQRTRYGEEEGMTKRKGSKKKQ